MLGEPLEIRIGDYVKARWFQVLDYGVGINLESCVGRFVEYEGTVRSITNGRTGPHVALDTEDGAVGVDSIEHVIEHCPKEA